MSKQKYYPAKPETEAGFKQPVSWLGGRDLIASLKGIIIYSLYGDNIDPRSWMKANVYPSTNELHGEDTTAAVDAFWKQKAAGCRKWKTALFKGWNIKNVKSPASAEDQDSDANERPEEFWFDYIADSGDGQQAVYSVACLCLSDLWLNEDDQERSAISKAGDDAQNKSLPISFELDDNAQSKLLPRGSFLFLGGDTAYHVADYATLHERFQTPFRWAFKSVRQFLVETYWRKYLLREQLPINEELPTERFFYDGDPLDARNLKPACQVNNERKIFKFDTDWDGSLTKQFAEQAESKNPEDAKNADKVKAVLDGEPLRPLFGIPGNHDYYDEIDGFNRQFRRPPFENVEENKFYGAARDSLSLAIPTFERKQEASYVALRLPFDWWLLGIDSENKKLDFRQKEFFKSLLEKYKPKKLIIATSEPTTVFGQECRKDDKTANYLTEITAPLGLEQPFFNGGEIKPLTEETPPAEGEYCRLDLSGDTHHYARYWGPSNEWCDFDDFQSNSYASVVAGGGGAFFDPTETLIGESKVTYPDRNKEQLAAGEIPPRVTFPGTDRSRKATAAKLFDLWNIKKGGYVQIAGAAVAVIIYYYLTTAPYFQSLLRGARNSFPENISIGDGQWELGYWALLLIPSCILFYISGSRLHDLVSKLNAEKNNERISAKDPDLGRITQLRMPALLWFLASVCYAVFGIALWLKGGSEAISHLNGRLKYARTFSGTVSG